MNFEHLSAIIWLRWRLTCNQLARGSRFQAAVSLGLLVILGLGAIGAGAGGFLFGWLGMSHSSTIAMVVLWDVVIFAFLALWGTGLVTEIQRSESIDIARLLHLPIRLRQVFLLNYLASHGSPSIVLFAPMVCGLVAGLCMSKGPAFLLLLFPLAACLLALTAWTYCLRGWLASLMIQKRRRRAIVMWITVAFVLFFQLPNIMFRSDFFQKSVAKHKTGRDRQAVLASLIEVHKYVPPGWIGYSAVGLERHDTLPAVAVTAGGLLACALGLGRAHRSTIRFYTGAGTTARKAAAPPVQQRPGRRHRSIVEMKLPFLSDDTAGLATASLQNLLRAPEMRMAMILPAILICTMFSAQIMKTHRAPPELLLHLAPSLAAFVGCFSFANLLGNMFGMDRAGFRALVLLPTPRDRILAGKNLAFLPFALGSAVVMLIAAKLWVKFGWLSLLCGFVQSITAFFVFCLCFNLLSILAPYRLAPGSLQAKRPAAVVWLGIFMMMCLSPLLTIPVVIPSLIGYAQMHYQVLPWLPGNLLLSAVMLGIVGLAYMAVLPAQGRLLASREQRILAEVTHEQE